MNFNEQLEHGAAAWKEEASACETEVDFCSHFHLGCFGLRGSSNENDHALLGRRALEAQGPEVRYTRQNKGPQQLAM